LQSPIVQQLASLDACVVAEQPHGGAWRRRQVFEDDSGQTWRAIALPCWREVRRLTRSASREAQACCLS
jgi:uracil-DNA glycosylase